MTEAAPRPSETLTDADVVAYLRAHPRFLAEHPALYRQLAPPERVHGEIFADHMAALLKAARAEAGDMAVRADSVLAAGRAAAGLTQRVQEAVLALLHAESVAECVASDFPAALAIDAAGLCVEGEQPGHRSLPPGRVAGLLGNRAVVFRSGAAPDIGLHGEAARLAMHEALVRIPGDGPPALLTLAARDGTTLDAQQGSGALAFLGRALAVALGR